MSDPNMPPQGVPQGVPQGAPKPGISSNVFQNLSSHNPNDVNLMAASGQLSPDMTVRDYFSKMGVNVDGPVTQLIDLGKKMQANADPMTKMKNIAAGGAALRPGGMPPTMPGAKPMVAPPGQPAPSGLQGLMQKLGGQK